MTKESNGSKSNKALRYLLVSLGIFALSYIAVLVYLQINPYPQIGGDWTFGEGGCSLNAQKDNGRIHSVAAITSSILAIGSFILFMAINYGKMIFSRN